MDQIDNSGIGVIDFKDGMDKCWEATHFSK